LTYPESAVREDLLWRLVSAGDAEKKALLGTTNAKLLRIFEVAQDVSKKKQPRTRFFC